MASPSDELRQRAMDYATSRGMVLKHSLGFGKDGYVYATSTGSAVKVFESADKYGWERDCYVRLAAWGVKDVIGHHVPEILEHDDDCLVIEMTIVQPPYILDFVNARLDEEPDLSPEVREQWEQDRMEEFGARWPRVRLIMDYMWEQFGIYLTDIHPRNIAFGENDGEADSAERHAEA